MLVKPARLCNSTITAILEDKYRSGSLKAELNRMIEVDKSIKFLLVVFVVAKILGQLFLLSDT